MARFVCASLVLVGLVHPFGSVLGQTLEAGATFRVFLNDGHALPSYGEYALVGDRLVFVLPIGDPQVKVELQLMSLPLSSVDMTRTSRYAEAMRARSYANTRGPAEYSAVAADVSLALAELEKEKDPKRRLELAQDARGRLLAWSNEHYGYRVSEIRDLAGLFDDVIGEMGGGTAAPRLTVSLSAGPAVPALEPELPTLSSRDSIELAVSAANVADAATDRPAILRAALAVATILPGMDDLRALLSRRLSEERAVGAAYAKLTSELTARAAAAARIGDVRGAEAAVAQLDARDRALGGERPQDMLTLRTRLDAAVLTAREHRQALDHWTMVGKSLYAYERHVRPILSALDGFAPVLTYIRDSKHMAVERVLRAEVAFARLEAQLDQIAPPEDVRSVHSTLMSAVYMARQASKRRRQTDAAPNPLVAQEAASAAAGTLMLAAQAREDLLAHLLPPRFQ